MVNNPAWTVSAMTFPAWMAAWTIPPTTPEISGGAAVIAPTLYIASALIDGFTTSADQVDVSIEKRVVLT